ncbi:MAG: hypothetical protein M0Q91_17700 [Methanoregula sp.]|nr:hypothetical protein [Methanoregula sp.]
MKKEAQKEPDAGLNPAPGMAIQKPGKFPGSRVPIEPQIAVPKNPGIETVQDRKVPRLPVDPGM